MRKKRYVIGDYFEIPLDEHMIKGFGRILKIDKPIIFVELYSLTPSKNSLELDKVATLHPLLSIWCTDHGFKNNIWKIIGNIPINKPVVMPNFWTTDAFDPNKIVLIKDDDTRYTITKDQIGDAQPYGIFGHEAVRIRYLHELKLKGYVL